MKRIVTVQHTQSLHHTNGMVGSWTDWELTDLGRTQASNIARNIAREFGAETWRVYSSDLARARQTAQPIAEALGAEMVPEKILRERNLGAAVGQSVAWLRDNLQREEKTVYDRCFEDAESRADVWKRLEPFMQTLLRRPEHNILLVSHGETLGIFHALWMGMKVTDLDHAYFVGKAGGVSVLVEDDTGRHVLRAFSDMTYMLP